MTPPIINWDCELRLENKAQLAALISWLLADDIDWEFSVSVNSDRGWPLYFLRIETGIWAHNLSRLGVALEAIDHNEGIAPKDNNKGD
jgi:hypothetical protein